ncbi:MAG: TetR/AcrR family transcriptional regulator [Thermomicrobiales bacterium]|nr:TetR/AcrR family transcriptional regulator [Thermomicrobiales bacterium]
MTAERLFAEFGYTTVTMDLIAREAGVAVATVYQHFPARTAIIEAMADAVVAAPDLNVEQVTAEVDPIERFKIGARIISDLNERAWLVNSILRDSRGSDARLAEIWNTWQSRHYNAVRRAVDSLAAAGDLRAGVDTERAADVLYALMGSEVYRALVNERGWTRKQYEEWLFQITSRELLDGPPNDLR